MPFGNAAPMAGGKRAQLTASRGSGAATQTLGSDHR